MANPHRDIKFMIFNFKKFSGVYFRVPKVASTSLLMSFRKIDEVEKIEDYEKEYDQNSFKFAFVRNPFDRLASCFRHVIKKGAMSRIQDDPELYRDMSFKEFVDVISKRDIQEMDIHFRPQHTFLPENLDFIGKFENLEEDYKTVCEKLGIGEAPSLRWENATGKTLFEEYYDDEIMKKVADIYRRDFELFGYDPDSKILA